MAKRALFVGAFLVLILAWLMAPARPSSPVASGERSPRRLDRPATSASEAPTLARRAVDTHRGEVPSWARQGEALVVASPACGTSERWLSLPERANIELEKQDRARAILEDLRLSILERVAPDMSAGGAQDVYDPASRDDEVREGAIYAMRERWRAFDDARRMAIMTTLSAGLEADDDFVHDVLYIREKNAEARARFEELFPGLGNEETRTLWESALSWCSETLVVK